MMPTGSEPLPPTGAFGPTSRQDAIAASQSASAHISTVLGIWSSGSSTRSNSVAGSLHATTSSQPTTSPSSSLHQSGCGCALMSPRPISGGAISVLRSPSCAPPHQSPPVLERDVYLVLDDFGTLGRVW